MGPWESFAAGWTGFWDHKGVIAVTAVDFAAVLVGEAMPAAAGIPLFHLPGHPFGPPSLWFPALRAGGLYLSLTGFLLLFVVTPFMAAATPGSLLDALSGEFSLIRYCEKGVRYFGRSLAFLLFCLAVIVIAAMLSSALFFLLTRTAGSRGGLLAAILLLAPWIYIGEILVIALVRYLTGREYGLWICLTQAAYFVREKYLPFLGLAVIIISFSLLGLVVTVILNRIPVVGFLLGVLVTVAVDIIELLAVMNFAGVV